MSDSEFKSLYINEFGPMYIMALFMTLVIMGVIFIGWNGEFKCRIKSRNCWKNAVILCIFDNLRLNESILLPFSMINNKFAVTSGQEATGMSQWYDYPSNLSPNGYIRITFFFYFQSGMVASRSKIFAERCAETFRTLKLWLSMATHPRKRTSKHSVFSKLHNELLHRVNNTGWLTLKASLIFKWISQSRRPAKVIMYDLSYCNFIP